MLSGLSSLLFGSGGTDAAAVDQTPARPPTLPATPVDTVDMDNDWVLVDRPDIDGPVESEQPTSEETGEAARGPGAVEREEEDSENRLAGHPARDTAVQQRAVPRPVPVRGDLLQAQQLKVTCCTQRQQQRSMTKPLSRRRLDLSNKARTVTSEGRRPVSARRRVLQPSGQMNGRQSQRQY